MSDEEIIRACRDAGFTDKEWKAMTYQTGSYDITEPSVVLKNLCKIIADNENEKQQAIVDAINTLRKDEGSWVTLVCDNPDFDGPDCIIECGGEWTEFKKRRIEGDSLSDCLKKAVNEKNG